MRYPKGVLPMNVFATRVVRWRRLLGNGEAKLDRQGSRFKVQEMVQSEST